MSFARYPQAGRTSRFLCLSKVIDDWNINVSRPPTRGTSAWNLRLLPSCDLGTILIEGLVQRLRDDVNVIATHSVEVPT
jgi:hypothetical protein